MDYSTQKKDGTVKPPAGPGYMGDMKRYVAQWLDSLTVGEAIEVVLSWFDSKELQDALKSKLETKKV